MLSFFKEDSMLSTASFHQSLSLGKRLLENILKENLDVSYRKAFETGP